eukprot:81929-Alexandrium_andersonii.AAC.1
MLEEAILLSREEAFNHEVYALIRLTKHSDAVRDHLLTSPELQHCRARVAAAGCIVQPPWAGGGLLF